MMNFFCLMSTEPTIQGMVNRVFDLEKHIGILKKKLPTPKKTFPTELLQN